jgi:predicted amidohydrolase YtcJ
VSTPDPWQAIHVAVNRTHPTGARPDPLLLEQALDLATCLRAYTTGSAWLARTRTAGHLALGAPADLAVASTNPFTLPADQICTVHNTLTVAAGRIVHI